jgi:hypothetical protein
MKLETAVEYIELALALLLVVRLFALHLGRIYPIFSAFLLTDIAASLMAGLYDFRALSIDYRILYSADRTVAWFFSLWTIYALLSDILKGLPGILRYSRRLLHGTFAAAALAGASIIAMDNAVSKVEGWRGALDRLVAITFVMDQTIAITILVVLVVMLGFFLWFPVVVSRNLAVFSVGYVVYFASITALSFLQSFGSSEDSHIGSVVAMLVTCVCYAYWTIFLSKAGEKVPVRIGHGWEVDKQQHMIRRLEEVNGVLLQTLANKKAL